MRHNLDKINEQMTVYNPCPNVSTQRIRKVYGGGGY